jgi:hypothetical protein
MKTSLFTLVLTLGLALFGRAALTHHGWSWTTGENAELVGVIKEVRLGNRTESSKSRWTARCGPSKSVSRGATPVPA